MRNMPTATQTIKRTVEHGAALCEITPVEVNRVHLILHHVNTVTEWTTEQCKVLIAAVVATTTINLVVVKRLFGDEITHGVRMDN